MSDAARSVVLGRIRAALADGAKPAAGSAAPAHGAAAAESAAPAHGAAAAESAAPAHGAAAAESAAPAHGAAAAESAAPAHGAAAAESAAPAHGAAAAESAAPADGRAAATDDGDPLAPYAVPVAAGAAGVDPGALVPPALAADADADLVARFAERVADYRATVVRVAGDSGSIAAAVAEACARHGARRLLVPAGLPAEWLTDAIEPLGDDPPLDHAELGAADGVITGCALAIAETGTIVLDAGPGQGRRALTLLPDLHVCVVEAERVVDGVATAITSLAPAVGAPVPPITFISGPSATSDIELNRVEGVHGPRRLEVVVAG